MLAVALALLMGAPSPLFAQAARADLAKARTLYNQRQFDEAIAVATQARRQPDIADMAAIVLARAHLERYREHADPSDLGAAREALSAVRATSLDVRDQAELILALGQSLFLEDDFGAAAEMLESGLERAASADPCAVRSHDGVVGQLHRTARRHDVSRSAARALSPVVRWRKR